ncbi:MAG: trigger factor [Gammaproteobacteria bacterium]|nr:trigger factor [Gammaproteobacteria bacterium]
MQSEVENLSGLSRKIKVTVPQQQVQEEVDKRIKDLAKTVTRKGFRQGKVPKTVVEREYGPAVRQEVIQDILWQTLQQAFKEQNLYPAGTPQIELKNIEVNAPLQYEASFEVFPEIKLDIEDITIEKPATKIDEAHVTDVIEKLRKQNINWKEVDRAAAPGDLVVIDFEGFIDNLAFEGGSAKDFRLELGSKMMIPGFEEPILGAKAGDAVEAEVVFPEDYHAKQYASKPAKFAVKINKVMEAELPDLNDAFAADLGVSNGSLEGLQTEVRQNLENELERRIRDKVKVQIIDKMLAKNEIDVPQAAVEEEIKRLQKMMQKQLSAQTGQKEGPLMPREHFEDQARKNVILGLLLSQWIQDNQLKVDAAKVRDRVDQIASGYHHPHEIVNWYYGNKEALAEVEGMVLEEQAIDKILEVVKVVDKPVSFEELMNVGMQRGEDD